MNQREEQNDEVDGGEQRDSRLETFLRRASAIIAAEKGINSVAKAKLDELARNLHLPDELFEQGLQRLQASNSPIGNLTDYEKAFLKFLVREFSQKREGTVLSISIEEKAIAHARSRFGIEGHRAEQLFDFQAEESGIGRLSRSDAREFGQQMILDIVGDNFALDDDQQKKVSRIGRRWGCNPEEVEQLVESQIRKNKRTRRQATRRPFVLGFGVLLVIALGGYVGKGFYDNYEIYFGPKVVKKKEEPAPEKDEPNLDEAKTELEIAFPELAASIKSKEFDVRAEAMEQATMRLLEQDVRSDQQFLALRSWFLQEPETKVASRFARVIQSAIFQEPKSNRNRALEQPYRASSLAYDVYESIDQGRHESRRQLLGGLLSQIVEDAELLDAESIDTSIANRQWNQLIENSWTSPGRSSILIEPLFELTKSRLPERELQQYVSRSVRTIILADKNQWRNMLQPTLSAIESADEVQRIEWIDIWFEEFDGSKGFREFAGKHLVESLMLENEVANRDVESVLKSVRLDWRNRRLKPALIRHEKINQRIEKLRPYFGAVSDSELSPDLIFQTALTANLCLEAISITDSGRAGDDGAWSEVDSQLQRLDSRLREFVFLEEQAAVNGQPNSAAFDTTGRDRDLVAFKDLSEDNQAKRLAAIERLPGHARKFDAIPQSMADSLADYILSPLDPDEWLQLQRVLPDLIKWPSVLLAISDRVPESTASETQLRTMFTVLAGFPLEDDREEWKQAIGLNLLKLTHQMLLAKDDVDANSADSDWIRLEKFLQTTYYRRSTLLGSQVQRSNLSVVDNAKYCVRAVRQNEPVTKRIIGLIENSTNNELEQVVLLNELLAEAKTSTGVSLGRRLLQTELKLMQVWNRQREQQLRELIDGS